jgi:uncharacterized protein (DUF1015 family)
MIKADVSKRTDEGLSWSGIRITVNGCKLQRAETTAAGRMFEIDDRQLYRVATLDFMADKLEKTYGIGNEKIKIQSATGLLLRDLIFDSIKGKVLSPERYYQKSSPRVVFKGVCT